MQRLSLGQLPEDHLCTHWRRSSDQRRLPLGRCRRSLPLTFVELDGNENAPQRRPHGPALVGNPQRRTEAQWLCTPPISSRVVRLGRTLRCCHPPAHPGRKSTSDRKRSAVKPPLHEHISLAEGSKRPETHSAFKHRNGQNVHEPFSSFSVDQCSSNFFRPTKEP